MAKKAAQLDLFPLGTFPEDIPAEQPDGDLAGSGDVPPPMVVHNDHRIVINYNAAGQAARHRSLTRIAPERDRAGVF